MPPHAIRGGFRHSFSDLIGLINPFQNGLNQMLQVRSDKEALRRWKQIITEAAAIQQHPMGNYIF